MDINGVKVTHKAFGEGVVSAVSDGAVTVRFPAGEKKFIYPDAFQGYLSLEDAGARRSVEALIRRRAEQEARRRAQEREEFLRRQRSAGYTPLANSHLVFDLAPGRAAAVCADGHIPVGVYRSGARRGTPRCVDKCRPNSACLLTTLPESGEESRRRVAGVFMVRDDFFGEDCADGLVTAHPDYRLLFDEELPLLFWTYTDGAPLRRWGGVPLRYCPASLVRRLLSDAAEKLPQAQRAPVIEFYNYFCRVNLFPSVMTDRPSRPD